MILIKNEQTFPVDVDKLKRDAQTILNALDYPDFDLGILLASREAMLEFNKVYRNIDKPTDIISFAYHEVIPGERIVPKNEEDKNLGDVIICPQFVHDDLERWQQTFQERMDILLVHGICHLLGYDHFKDTDYEVMKIQEAFLLDRIKKE